MAVQRLALSKVQAFSRDPKWRWIRLRRVEEATIELEKAKDFLKTVEKTSTSLNEVRMELGPLGPCFQNSDEDFLRTVEGATAALRKVERELARLGLRACAPRAPRAPCDNHHTFKMQSYRRQRQRRAFLRRMRIGAMARSKLGCPSTMIQIHTKPDVCTSAWNR